MYLKNLKKSVVQGFFKNCNIAQKRSILKLRKKLKTWRSDSRLHCVDLALAKCVNHAHAHEHTDTEGSNDVLLRAYAIQAPGLCSFLS